MIVVVRHEYRGTVTNSQRFQLGCSLHQVVIGVPRPLFKDIWINPSTAASERVNSIATSKHAFGTQCLILATIFRDEE